MARSLSRVVLIPSRCGRRAGPKVAPIEANPQASNFESLLGESRELACERLRVALRAMLDKSDEALTALVNGTQSREAQEAYRDARKVLIGGRRELEAAFHQNFLGQFAKL